MNVKISVAVLITALLMVGCTGAENSPAPAGDGELSERPARGMPMGGDMAEMRARMMGGGSPEDAPAPEAATASAPECPDISQEQVDRGREVWSGPGNCYTCHGGDATGSQLAPHLADGEWLNVEGSYASITEVVRTGVSQPRQYPAPMPPMGGGSLSRDQVCAVAAYVYSLSH